MLYSFIVDFVKLMAVTVHEILRKIPVSRKKNGNNNFVIKTTKSRAIKNNRRKIVVTIGAEKWLKVAILTNFKVVMSFLHVIFAFSKATKIANSRYLHLKRIFFL